MDWQFPDIGKTITNNILPSSLSEYAVYMYREIHSFCRSAVVGYFRTFPYRVALLLWILIGLYMHVVGTVRLNNMNHVGHVSNDYFNRTNPQWRRRCNIIITQKTRALLVVVQRKVFSPGNV